MKTYEVQITQEALQDLELIYDYIANKLFAPQAAEAIYNSLTGAILSLDCFPERCALLESQSEFFKSIRRMVVGKYSVFYVIKGDVVIVTSILYSASDIEKRLLARIR